jgi:hypothetical protein
MTDKPRIPYTQPSITELEVRYATDAATDAAAKGWMEPTRGGRAHAESA